MFLLKALQKKVHHLPVMPSGAHSWRADFWTNVFANYIVQTTLFSEYTALSNMPVTQSSRLSGGWVRDKYATTPVMSTYLLAFVVAAFDQREAKQNNGPLVSMN